jgi:hypothetical protein
MVNLSISIEALFRSLFQREQFDIAKVDLGAF